MIVSELLELLRELPEDAEVRLAHQPAYPMELSLGKVAFIEPEADEDDEGMPCYGVVYLGEGEQIGYLPGEAARALGFN